MVAIDIQLTASHVDWPRLRRASLEVEARGFDALWVMDHLAGAPMGGTSSLECFTWLGALAEATSRIHLGVLVATTTPFTDPVSLRRLLARLFAASLLPNTTSFC